MSKYFLILLNIWLVILHNCTGISSPISPFITYEHSVALEKDIADLWWIIDDVEQEITFELDVKSRGWIALGISPGKNI